MITEDINPKQRVLVYDVDLSGELISRDLKKPKSQNLIHRQCYHKEKVRESRTKEPYHMDHMIWSIRGPIKCPEIEAFDFRFFFVLKLITCFYSTFTLLEIFETPRYSYLILKMGRFKYLELSKSGAITENLFTTRKKTQES